MMKHLKKTPRLVTAAVLSLTLLSSALLCSCNGAPNTDTLQTKESEQLLQQDSGTFTEQASEQLTQQEPVVNLKYGKKYYSPSSIRDPKEDTYFIFRENGTGVYHCYRDFILYGEQQYYSYEIEFVYEIVDGTAVCFFDSLKMDPADTINNADSLKRWHWELEISKNFLFASSTYICEDFLPRIPNFGK